MCAVDGARWNGTDVTELVLMSHDESYNHGIESQMLARTLSLCGGSRRGEGDVWAFAKGYYPAHWAKR